MTQDEKYSIEIEREEEERSRAWANSMEAEAAAADDYQDVIEAHAVKPEFHVTDETSASWVVRKIVEARARKERVQQQLLKIQAECDREEEFFLARYQVELEEFARRETGRQKEQNAQAGRGQSFVSQDAGKVGCGG